MTTSLNLQDSTVILTIAKSSFRLARCVVASPLSACHQHVSSAVRRLGPAPPPAPRIPPVLLDGEVEVGVQIRHAMDRLASGGYTFVFSLLLLSMHVLVPSVSHHLVSRVQGRLRRMFVVPVSGRTH
jgi:hypothetical protein